MLEIFGKGIIFWYNTHDNAACQPKAQKTDDITACNLVSAAVEIMLT